MRGWAVGDLLERLGRRLARWSLARLDDESARVVAEGEILRRWPPEWRGPSTPVEVGDPFLIEDLCDADD